MTSKYRTRSSNRSHPESTPSLSISNSMATSLDSSLFQRLVRQRLWIAGITIPSWHVCYAFSALLLTYRHLLSIKRPLLPSKHDDALESVPINQSCWQTVVSLALWPPMMCRFGRCVGRLPPPCHFWILVRGTSISAFLGPIALTSFPSASEHWDRLAEQRRRSFSNFC